MPSEHRGHVLDNNTMLQGDEHSLETFPSKKYKQLCLNTWNFILFKMYNLDLYILTMVLNLFLYYIVSNIKNIYSMFKILTIWNHSQTILSAQEVDHN